jgi:hypothetical protein
MALRKSVAALYGACLVLGFCPKASVAATATNLVTICTSATTTTQAAKCTAWQYNAYSPTAYIESYPTVTPAETGINDPNYEYRLGSSLTPTMGVKVCPTALTPGVSFNSPQADPCPNNRLVAASTVLPANTYAVATSPAGIVVYQVNTSGVSVVPGSPFVPSPAPTTISGTEVPSPTLTALDPAGQYLYALYDLSYYVSEAIYSFKMINGVPSQLSSYSNLTGGDNSGSIYIMLATAQHIYLFNTCFESIPCGSIINTNNGVIASGSGIVFSVPESLSTTETVINLAVDPQEQFLYMYMSATGSAPSDTIAIYSLNFAASSATLAQIVSQSGQFLVGAK